MNGSLMAPLVVSAALLAAWTLMRGRIHPGPHGRMPRLLIASPGHRTLREAPRRRLGWARGRSSEASDALHCMAIRVGGLAALLRAGGSPAQVWKQAALVQSGQGRSGVGGTPGDAAAEEILSAAGRAADMGRPIGAAIRAAVTRRQETDAQGPRDPGRGVLTAWVDVASCVEVAEASGSPLAEVLDRLAIQLEADADAAAARAVALAGPRATAGVLSILPLAGLVLGVLMGVDPLALLVSTPWGLLCLGVGVLLTVAGRAWSARLVRAAAEER